MESNSSQNKEPIISIITVCYNSEKTIEDTIKSVIRQSYPNIQYIIIDGKSTDNTINIVKKYIEHIDVFISEKDQGIYDAMNKGITHAKGELVGILNSDDFFEEDAVCKIVDAYMHNPNYDIYYGDINFIDYEKGITYTVKSLKDVYDFRYGKMPVRHPATFVKKELYDKIGVFNPKYKRSSDYEFILRAIDHDSKFYYVDEVITNMRSGGATRDFYETFRETRDINIEYGVPKFIANLIFIKSCLKAFVVEKITKISLFNNLYKSFKKGKEI